MNDGRGAKGSINDRLISMMYRNRYKKLQLQKEHYSKPNKQQEKEFLKTIGNFDIDNDALSLDEKEQEIIREFFSPLNNGIVLENPHAQSDVVKGIEESAKTIDYYSNDSKVTNLHELSEKLIEYNPETEVFDFDRFDYYEMIEKKTGIGEIPENDKIDVEKEIDKVDDEIVIVVELEKFIDDSLVLIEEIKSDLVVIEKMVQEQYTVEQVMQIEENYKKIKEKLDKLKEQYEVVKNKYNFEDFEILSSIEMMLAIDDYKDKSSLNELETLVDFCKNEIEQIDGILIEDKKSVGVAEEIVEKKVEIKRRDKDFSKNKAGVIYLDDLERKIAKEAREQRIIILSLEKKLANFTTEIVPVIHAVYHTEKLFGSFLRVAAGILTAPFSGRSIFGTMLGTHLINKGIRGIRNSLTPEINTTDETIHRYTDIEREILSSKDYVNTTDSLISDSIDQLDKFDEEFKHKFSSYTGLIPEYKQVENQIQDLKNKLAQKQIEINVMKKDLDRQYEVNKVKVRKAS